MVRYRKANKPGKAMKEKMLPLSLRLDCNKEIFMEICYLYYCPRGKYNNSWEESAALQVRKI